MSVPYLAHFALKDAPFSKEILDADLDFYSRYIVGWQVARCESAAVYRALVQACCETQCVVPAQLTIHADRGAPMTAKSTALLYVDLGITKSHSRPYTSNDTPYSEANFRTLKYRPDMPDQLGSLEHARQVVAPLVDWYNDEHYHVGPLTPAPCRRPLRPRAGHRRRTTARARRRPRRTSRSASCAVVRRRKRRRRPRGSTRRPRRPLLSKLHEGCLKLVETHGTRRPHADRRDQEHQALHHDGRPF